MDQQHQLIRRSQIREIGFLWKSKKTWNRECLRLQDIRRDFVCVIINSEKDCNLKMSENKKKKKKVSLLSCNSGTCDNIRFPRLKILTDDESYY
jgi:hypothetical protein